MNFLNDDLNDFDNENYNIFTKFKYVYKFLKTFINKEYDDID